MASGFTRRGVLGRGMLGCLCCAGMGLSAPAMAAGKATDLSADQALALLKEGNATFKTDSPVQAVTGRERRLEIARGQTPFAVLVSCSDSRI